MVLRTLLTMGEQHGYGIARRIEQTSGGQLSINYGTLYPALLKLEQEGLIALGLGHVRQQPQGQVLPADQGRPEADRARHPAVGGDLGDHDALPAASEDREPEGDSMKIRPRLVHRMAGVFAGRRAERELAAELDSHLQLHIDDNLRAGMTPDGGRRRALIALGGIERTKEAYRDRRGVPGARVAAARPALRRAHAAQESRGSRWPASSSSASASA